MVENSFIKKLKSSGRSLVVFYGSQTGTAEEFAGRLAKEGIRYQLKGMVADPEECDVEELLSLKTIEKSLAVFCLATYGEGDPTDNAMEFYEWITNGDHDLTGLNYAVSFILTLNLLKNDSVYLFMVDCLKFKVKLNNFTGYIIIYMIA